MTTTVTAIFQTAEQDPGERLAGLLPDFAGRAARYDEADEFAAANFEALKHIRLMSAAVPAEFGGDGLDVAALSPLLRTMARACSSTALAYAMHTHVVALMAWRWRNQKAPFDAMLTRIAREQIVLISSGGTDWLDSGGTARRVDGGFVIDAVKTFASGVPAGTMINTSAVYDDPEAGPTALHFMAPLSAREVAVEPTWRALGMRGTGSHTVRIQGFFVADAGVAARRPRGKWHPLFHMISMIAFPIIYSVYFGIAEAARDAALARVHGRPVTPQLIDLAGRMDTKLAAARIALDDMLATSATQPGLQTTNRIHQSRSNFVEAALAAVESALELVGGSGYLRDCPVERHFRDIQAARFHPLQPAAQRSYAGRLALGLDIDDA